MTPEKFRQWIVILFAALIVTMWVGFGIKLCRAPRYPMPTQRAGVRSQMPGRMPRRATMPTRRMPTRKPAPATKPAAPAETAK
ncbi:MAG: hypothetical protein WBC74_06195 [Candidatus Omnitrophota bacterium]